MYTDEGKIGIKVFNNEGCFVIYRCFEPILYASYYYIQEGNQVFGSLFNCELDYNSYLVHMVK